MQPVKLLIKLCLHVLLTESIIDESHWRQLPHSISAIAITASCFLSKDYLPKSIKKRFSTHLITNLFT